MIAAMNDAHAADTDDRIAAPDTGADTPALRLFSLLETLAHLDRPPTLQELVDETGFAKPTVHRMLQQLEAGGLLSREVDGRRYGMGTRLRRLAETLLLNDGLHGARHLVLQRLVDEVGESCNITAVSGSEVVYLDRVETAAPLRFHLRAGSRVPMHCSASGKVFLAQMTRQQRRRLLAAAPLVAFTPRTLTDIDQLEQELERVKAQGFAIDDEEYSPGLMCIAAPVPMEEGPSNMCVAIQAPILRLDVEKAIALMPALHRAVAALSRIASDETAGTLA